jgi:outer membrane protein OmpA-like peptidoglycan-associated protein
MSVRDALVKNGVAANAIEAKGYGFDKPVASNKTKAGRTENRRVEITINGTN